MSGNPNIPKLQKTERAQLMVDCLNLPKATGIEDAVWEDFQLAHLNDDGLLRIEKKSRQIAWSFISACDAVADAVLEARDSVFGSINLDEATEKIRYANSIYENLELSGLPKMIRNNQLEIEFSNGARLTSYPSKAIRGRPKSNVNLDEFHHVQQDRKIYTGSFAVISKGGRLRIGSSPMGAQGMFHEIFTDVKKYPDYIRKSTPWWEVQAFCKNVKLAYNLAPKMTTAERVEFFGKDRIKALFANVPLEDFQQEFEAAFIDESTAWITINEIEAVEDDELTCVIQSSRDDKIDDVLKAIEDLRTLINEKKVEAAFGVGVDIGRTRNATEIFAVGLSPTNTYPLRLMLTLNNCPFESQEAVLHRVFELLPVVGGEVDNGGIGMQIAQSLANKYPFKVRQAQFTQETKKLWATDAKMLIQKKKTPLPVNRDLKYQIHSIKRIVSPSKNLLFDTARNEKHHADKFWSWVLSLSAARRDWLTENAVLPGSYSVG